MESESHPMRRLAIEECKVIALLSHGNSPVDAAKWMGLSVRQVTGLISSAKKKLDVDEHQELCDMYTNFRHECDHDESW
jgi:DNA-binding CsgD family transcriptional regulator